VRSRARILTGESGVRGKPILSPGASEAAIRRITREEIEGRHEAERLIQQARAEAGGITARALDQATDAVRVAVRDAETDARARVAVECLAMRQGEQKRLERDRDRIIAVAVVLAERLLGASLELDPSRIASLARGVLAEAGGARRAVIDAHPLDAQALREHLTISGLEVQSVEVRGDLTLARGELRLHTDVGTIDAKLALRFDRLATALHDVLR
jgi:flagellar biosynthesis/type III secretory pathway protein FliH